MRKINQIKRLFSVVLTMFVFNTIVFAQEPVTYTLQASDVTVEDGVLTACSYDFSANTNGTALIIPDDLGITAIADGEADWYGNPTAIFADKNITSVALPANLSQLGDYAFYGNAIQTLNLPTTLTKIGDDAFNGNNIDSVFIPNTVKTIGANCFYENSALDTVVFEQNSKLIFIGSHAFVYTAVDDIQLPSSVVPDNNFEYWLQLDNTPVVRQGGEIVDPSNTAFVAKFDYMLTDDDVVVEDGIITSCSYDFSGRFIVIPDELDGQTVLGVAGASSQTKAIFYGKSMLALTLPSTIETIGNMAFNANSIDTLTIPSSLVSIGDYAFWGYSLDTIIFEDNSHLDNIGYKCFANNSDDLSMVLPTPVKEGYEFNFWRSYSGIDFNAGTIITDFETSYEANFTMKAGSSIINLAGELDLGEVTVTTSDSVILTISNTGNAAFTVSSIDLPTGFSADWTSGDIAVDSEQEVKITFSPTEAKDYSGIITINSDALYGVDTIEITAIGILEELVSFTGFDDINVENGTAVSAIEFPTTLSITTTGTKTSLTITGASWSCESYDASVEGTYTFESDLTTQFASANIGVSTVSPTVSINVIVDKAISITENDFVVSVYPNPVKNNLTIQSAQPAKVELFDAIGRKVYTKNSSTTTCIVDLSEMKTGFYFVKVTANDKSFVKQVIKE